MFKKLLFLFIVFMLIISCRKATTRPSKSDLGTPPSEEGIPDIPDITPPDSEEDYYIKADDTEDTIISKIKKYYQKYGIYVALIDDTEENIEKNKTIETINTIINDDIFYEGVFVNLSKTDMTKIAANLFSENKNLSSIELPASIVSIGNSAFSNAKNLTAINFPSVLNEIGDGAFYGCVNLQEVNLEYTQIKIISNQSFDGCSKLAKVTLPSMLSAINEKAFYNCKSLTSINFPSSLTNIGIYTFYTCSSLKEVNLKDTKITILSHYIFSDCTSLNKVVFPDVLLGIENSAFLNCISLEEISFPDGFIVMGNSVFSGCTKLKKVNLNSNIQHIYHYAFNGCTSLLSISLPSSLIELGKAKGAIFPNSGLVNVEYLGTDPSSINIYGNIFENSNPQNLYLPNVDDPTLSDLPQDTSSWENFLGYNWAGTIHYKTPMPNE